MKGSKESEFFTSRLALLLAVLGIAIGTGNIWRFPRIMAQNGGGSFIIPWIIFLFTWSIPLIIIEFGIGKRTRKGTAGAFGKLIGKRYLWMGAFVGFCSMAIMFYYSVVMGWCLKYLIAAANGDIHTPNHEYYWSSFIGSIHEPIFFHFLCMGMAVIIAYRGIAKGIEKANYVLIPSLFLIMTFAAVKVLGLPGSKEGLRFLFTPHLKDLLNYRIWLEALSQSAWSTGAGWGLILTYAVYMRSKEDIVVNSVLTGLGDSLASILAALSIIPVVFTILPREQALEVMASGNTGLTFIWIPQLFEKIMGGNILLPLFFLTLCFAALSSLIAMVELVVRIFMDTGMERKKSVLIVGIIGFLFGIPSAIKIEFFKNQDWTWGLGLLLNGIFLTYAVIKFGTSRFRRELINIEGNNINLGRWFEYVIAFVIPIEFICVLGWWFYQSATVFDPQGWWNPFHTTSIGTCIFQWGGAIAVLLLLNRWMGKKMLRD
jgi:NSS family neurotransmitter:Na+ symporter